MKSLRTLSFLLCGFAALASAETVKDREGAVREDKAKLESGTRWIYNDFEAGFAEAKKSGKPLLVVLRCVPCLSCMGIDTEVLVENEELTPLMDQFVRVRLINANALDLSKFQFDFDLSFSTLFFNGDGTVYGRYGSWEHQRDPQNAATATFKVALERALKIHQGYPTNKAALAGKQGKPSRFKTPIDMPGLQGKFKAELDWSGKVVQSCVHCHQLGDVQRLELRDAGQPFPTSLIYPHPAPEAAGIELSKSKPLTIAGAGLPGLAGDDVLLSLAGQPLISDADISWVLHNSPETGQLEAVARRGDEIVTATIPLAAGWRENSDISRRVGSWPMRAMAFGGLLLVELTDEERQKNGVGEDQLALLAKHVGQYGNHAAAKREGWVQGDILVEIDGSDARHTESQLIGRFIQEHKPGKKIPATVLRGSKRVELKIPIQ